MNEHITTALVIFVAFLLLIAAVLIVWGIFREIAIKQAQSEQLELVKDVITTLKDSTHMMDTVIRSVEGSNLFTKDKQTEILEIMKLSEGRMMAAIERIERKMEMLLPKASGVSVFNTQANDGQTNQGQSVKGDQRR